MKTSLLAREGTGKELRGYQQRALDLTRASARAGHTRIVLQGPTGFGKTVVASRLIAAARNKGKRVIFTAPAVSLIDQTLEAFESEGLYDLGVMQGNHSRTDSLAATQIASVQTLARREIPEAALVIVDECHIRSSVIEQMMDSRPDVHFIGLSATPWARGMGLRWQDLVIPITLGELIDQGYLSRFAVYAPDLPDMSGVKTKRGDFDEAQAQQIMEGTALVGSVVENWLEHGGNRPTLLFGVNRAHSKTLQEAFIAAGVSAAYVDAHTDRLERRVIERRFRSGEVAVACSVRTLTTGIDWPVSCIIDAAPTRSNMLHVQKIGRGLRVNDGTEDLVIFDHAGNSNRLGLVTEINITHLDRETPGDRTAPERPVRQATPCSGCGVLFLGLECPQCGYLRRVRSDVSSLEGSLKALGGEDVLAQRAAEREAQERFYAMALHLAASKGYKPGWAKFRFKEKYGAWPDGMQPVPIPPDQAFMNYDRSRAIAYAKQKAKQEKQP